VRHRRLPPNTTRFSPTVQQLLLRPAFPELHSSNNHFLLSRAKTGSTGKKTETKWIRKNTTGTSRRREDKQKKPQKDQPAAAAPSSAHPLLQPSSNARRKSS
jgi:hypothetical protein